MQYEINVNFKGIKPIIGEIVGDSKIISGEVFYYKRKNYYLVECKCGNQRFVRTDIWKEKRSTKCEVCRNKQNYITNINRNLMSHKGFSRKHFGYKGFPLSYFNDYKHGAIRRNLEFNVTIEYCYELLVKQNFKCALSGVDICLFPENSNVPVTDRWSNPRYNLFNASLDRIDSTKGYIEGNLQWVDRKINRIKMNLPQNEFIELCKKVANHANQQPTQT